MCAYVRLFQKSLARDWWPWPMTTVPERHVPVVDVSEDGAVALGAVVGDACCLFQEQTNYIHFCIYTPPSVLLLLPRVVSHPSIAVRALLNCILKSGGGYGRLR